MRVLVVPVNREKHPYPVQPLGATYVAAAARRAGHEVALFDVNFAVDPLRELAAQIEGFRPDVVGISIRNVDNCAYPRLEFYIPWVRQVVDLVRETTPAPLVIGGSGLSCMPLEILEYLDVDLGVPGEGELTFIDLLACFAAKGDPTKVPGVAFRSDGRAGVNTIQRETFGVEDLRPARDLLPMKRYLQEGSVTAVQTKRGCQFKCSYCTYPVIEGKKVRQRPSSLVGDELAHLKEAYGVDYVFFTDNVFNYPVEQVIGICNEIADRKLGMGWTAFFNPAYMTREMAAAMVRSGCTGIEFGTEGGSPTILRSLRKGFNVETLKRSHRIATEAGLTVCHYLILGGPGETMETIDEGLSLMEELDPTAVIISTGVRIYPMTHMFEVAKAEGYDVSNLLVPQFYFAPFMREEPDEVIRDVAKRFPRFRFEGVHTKTPREVLQIMRRWGFRGPSWEANQVLDRIYGDKKRKAAGSASTTLEGEGAA